MRQKVPFSLDGRGALREAQRGSLSLDGRGLG